MLRGLLSLLLLLGAVARLCLPAEASEPSVPCSFQLGFRALHDALPEVVGECLENERYDEAAGDSLQRTTGGLLVWRRSDNASAFTDGYETWLIGPIGLQRRLNSQRFDWERPPASVEAVFLGDSHFGRWDVATAFAPRAVVNRGLPGQTSLEIGHRLVPDALALGPRLVFLIAGTNDILQGRPEAETEASLAAIADEAKRADVSLAVSTVPPLRRGTQLSEERAVEANRAVWALNERIRALAAARDVGLVDAWAALADGDGSLAAAYSEPDGIHLSAAGYARVAPLFAAYLDR